MPTNLEQKKTTVKESKTTVVPFIDDERLLSQFKQQSCCYAPDNIYQKLVTFDDIQPSELMLRTLNLYKNMWQNQPCEDYEPCSFGGGILAHLLLPNISQPSEIFTDDDYDNQEIMHDYNGEFYGIFKGVSGQCMIDDNYCCICFVYVQDGIRNEYQIICRRDNKDNRIPPAFIKAADLYCQLYDIKSIDHPFIFGAMMLSASAPDNDFHPGIEDFDDWFLDGVVNYLA